MLLGFGYRHFAATAQVFTLLFIFWVSIPSASAEEKQTGWWQTEGGLKGWWNYEAKRDPEDVVDPKIPPVEEIWRMGALDFARLLEKSKEKALTTLSQEDANIYYVLQDIARRKASAFAKLFENSARSYAERFGGVEREYSSVTPARHERWTNRRNREKRALGKYRKRYGILYFYKPECRYCKAAAEILDVFESRNDWLIEKINVNRHPKLAEFYVIEVVPTTILVRKADRERFFLTSGTVSVMELESRVVEIVLKMEENADTAERNGFFDTDFYLNPETADYAEKILKRSEGEAKWNR